MKTVVNIALLLTTLGSGEISASERSFQTIEAADQIVVVPKSAAMTWKVAKAPNCQKLYAALEEKQPFFAACLLNDTSVSSCAALKRSLYYIVWEQQETASGLSRPVTYNASVESINLVPVNLTESVYHQINVDRDLVVAGVVDPRSEIRLADARVTVAANSWLDRVSQLKLDKRVLDVKIGDDQQIILGNALQTCDMLGGNATLAADSVIDFEFGRLYPLESTNTIWDIYKDLRKTFTTANLQPRQVAQAGVKIGRALGDESQISAELVIDSLISFAVDESTLRQFKSAAQLRAHLPKQKSTTQANVTLTTRSEP